MMKLKKYLYGAVMGVLAMSMTSCYNADKDFPDYEGGTTAYFAYQYPVRTLILGNDIYDNTIDNAHKCHIYSTMGGAYGGRDAVVQVEVDNTLCDSLYFTDEGGLAAEPVLPMPSNYYSLQGNSIPYNGDQRGYVEVQFTDEFFKDPKAIKQTYVVPLVMKSVTGIDHILTGTRREGCENAPRQKTDEWDVLAKDYVLYCVKYINPWHAKYIRRGVDKTTENGKTTTYIRKDTTLINSDVEHYTSNPVNANDDTCSIATIDMNKALFSATVRTSSGKQTVNLILTFDGNKCTISSQDSNISVTGTGEYIEKGTKQEQYAEFQWGSMNGELVHRDILHLKYDVNFGNGKILVSTDDILVVQTRESNQKVFFTPKYGKQ